VAACQRHHQALRAQAGGVDAPAQAPVVFLGRRSFSGVFYTQGQAQRLDDWAELEAILAPWGSCVALSPEDWSRARSREGGPPVRVEADLGHHHNRQVLWVRPQSPMATP